MRSTAIWLPRAGAAIATIALVLGACAGGRSDADPTPTVTDEASSTASSPDPSPESTVAKPERPKAMQRDDAKGAAAAAEYFIELYPYVMTTGDTDEFEQMSHEECGFCLDTITQANAIRANGDSWSGGEVAVAVKDVYARDGLTGIFPIDLTIDQAAGKIANSDGSTIFEQDRTIDPYRAEVGVRNGNWQIIEIALQDGNQ